MNINSSFSEFSKSCHSVRLYDSKDLPISKELLYDCIKEAQNCPSACNRQAVRIKIILEPGLISKICSIQGGSDGFGVNAGSLLIITSDLSFYEPDERKLPMFECGIFALNLVYSLFEHRLGSCILNSSFTRERELQMSKVIQLPEKEVYASIIAVSRIPENETIIVANASKRDVEDIVSVYE